MNIINTTATEKIPLVIPLWRMEKKNYFTQQTLLSGMFQLNHLSSSFLISRLLANHISQISGVLKWDDFL